MKKTKNKTISHPYPDNQTVTKTRKNEKQSDNITLNKHTWKCSPLARFARLLIYVFLLKKTEGLQTCSPICFYFSLKTPPLLKTSSTLPISESLFILFSYNSSSCSILALQITPSIVWFSFYLSLSVFSSSNLNALPLHIFSLFLFYLSLKTSPLPPDFSIISFFIFSFKTPQTTPFSIARLSFRKPSNLHSL